MTIPPSPFATYTADAGALGGLSDTVIVALITVGGGILLAIVTRILNRMGAGKDQQQQQARLEFERDQAKATEDRADRDELRAENTRLRAVMRDTDVRHEATVATVKAECREHVTNLLDMVTVLKGLVRYEIESAADTVVIDEARAHLDEHDEGA